MNSQRRSLRKSLGTLIALVGFLSSVNPAMHPKIFRVSESFSANVTNIGFLSSVNAPVFLQMLGTAETFPAKIAKIELSGIVALLVPK